MDLSNQVTISVPFSAIVITVALVVAAFIGVLIYIYNLNKKVGILTPKYGFGGKNITAIVVVTFLAGISPFVAMLISKNAEIRMQAEELQSVVLNTQVLSRTDDQVIVGFSIVPMENGIAWENGTYSAVWEVTGTTSFTFIEQDLTRETPSYFTKALSPGEYTVKVKVTGEGFNLERLEELTF